MRRLLVLFTLLWCAGICSSAFARDAAHLQRWIDAIYATGIVATDTETTGLDNQVADLVGLSFSTAPGNGACHTGQTVVVDGQSVPECTLRAAIQAPTNLPSDPTAFIGSRVPGAMTFHDIVVDLPAPSGG